MYLKEIARELYRLEQTVADLERRLQAAPFSEQAGLEEELRRARAERNRLRGIIEAQKAEPTIRRPR